MTNFAVLFLKYIPIKNGSFLKKQFLWTNSCFLTTWETNQISCFYFSSLDITYAESSILPMKIMKIKSTSWFLLTLKACVRYFLSNFFIKWQAFKNFEKIFLSHLKSSFRSRDIQFFVIFPFLSILYKFKRANGSGIIYVINWLA